MRINTNVASLTAQEATANTNKALSSSLEKLGSGLRINKAADDASGLAIADKLRTQASSLGQGISNANSASALIQIADKAMSEQSNILDTVKTKLIQASTSTTNADGREAIRKDVQKLLTQFDNIAAQTNYNGTTLLQKSATETQKQDELSFQLGEDSSFDVNIVASKASNTADLGGGSDTVYAGAINVQVVDADGNSSVANNNIGVSGSQQIKTAGSITLENVDITAQGTETAGDSVIMNLSLSGTLDLVKAGEDAVFDASTQTTAIKDALAIIADANADFAFVAATGVATLTGGGSVDFGDLDFSGMEYTAGAQASSLVLNADGAGEVSVSITDLNSGTDKPLLGQTNIDLSAAATGGNLLADLKGLAADGLTAAKANDFMATVDEALTQMNANRSDFGSTQNQLESSIRNMQTTQTNLKAAESVIRDVDYASESASFNKQNIIAQAGTYAMSQANSMAQNVQKLLQ